MGKKKLPVRVQSHNKPTAGENGYEIKWIKCMTVDSAELHHE